MDILTKIRLEYDIRFSGYIFRRIEWFRVVKLYLFFKLKFNFLLLFCIDKVFECFDEELGFGLDCLVLVDDECAFILVWLDVVALIFCLLFYQV
jgi:hypothetical protein